jgi:hypothetical protein
MTDSNIITILGNMLIGIGLGLGLIAFVVWRVLRKFEIQVREMVRETVQEVEDSLVGIIVEEELGQLYCYRESDRQFVCQGSNISEIRKAFNQMYPDKTAYLAGGDPALIERIKAELTLLKEQEENENRVGV